MSNNMEPSKVLNDMGVNQIAPTSKIPNKSPEFFADKPKKQTYKTVIIIVAFVLIVLAIIFMGYIIKNTDYSQTYTNLIIIVSGIIAITGVLLV